VKRCKKAKNCGGLKTIGGVRSGAEKILVGGWKDCGRGFNPQTPHFYAYDLMAGIICLSPLCFRAENRSKCITDIHLEIIFIVNRLRVLDTLTNTIQSLSNRFTFCQKGAAKCSYARVNLFAFLFTSVYHAWSWSGWRRT